MKYFWEFILILLILANTTLFFLNENERKETELEGFRYDRSEMIKSRVRLYYMDKKYRVLVREYSKCKQGIK